MAIVLNCPYVHLDDAIAQGRRGGAMGGVFHQASYSAYELVMITTLTYGV